MTFRSYDNYQALLSKIIKSGNEVADSYYELTNETASFMGTTKGLEKIFLIDESFGTKFVEAIATFKEDTIGPYILEKYFLLIPSLKEAMEQLVNDCKETRRCVIQFPKEHCFQTMQFIVREKTVHVMCYMRSCNAIANFGHDFWICSLMAEFFRGFYQDMFNEELNEYSKIDITFGSLHIYKKDKGKVDVL